MVGGGSSGGGPLADLVPVDVTRSFKPDLATDADSGDDDTPDPGHVLNSSSEWSSSGVEASGEKKSPRGMIGIIKRRFKGKTIGGSGSMTIGRATLASGRREGLLSPPGSDYYEGARTDEFPKRSASPARCVRRVSLVPKRAAELVFLIDFSKFFQLNLRTSFLRIFGIFMHNCVAFARITNAMYSIPVTNHSL